MKSRIAAIILATGTSVVSAVDVSDVVVQQSWPCSRLIDVAFVIDGEAGAGARYDVTLTARNGTEELTVPSAAISGDVGPLAAGVHTLTIDPVAAGFPQDVMTRFNVTVAASNSPAYMIVDLATGAKTYNYDWSQLMDVSDATYKTDKMVFKHVSAGTFNMGCVPPSAAFQSVSMTSHVVRLTKDYWLGVYEVTQMQWYNMMGNWPSYFTNISDRACRPVENVTLAQVRGNWNIARFSPPATSFIGAFAARSGLSADLPTEAQIEYAMRAGDSENWYKNANSNDKLVSHARVQNNSGGYTYNSNESQDLHNITIATGGTAAVGSFLANDWGFYDLCGNVWEMCYDRASYKDHTGPQVDPVHDLIQNSIEIHGGCFNSNYQWANNTARSNSSTASWGTGFRVMAEY